MPSKPVCSRNSSRTPDCSCTPTPCPCAPRSKPSLATRSALRPARICASLLSSPAPGAISPARGVAGDRIRRGRPARIRSRRAPTRPRLPWRTLWSCRSTGISAVTVGSLPQDDGPDGGSGAGAGRAEGSANDPADGTTAVPARPVAALPVPEGTAGAHPASADGAAPVGLALVQHDLWGPARSTPPGQVLLPSEEDAGGGAVVLSRGADYVRVWDRSSGGCRALSSPTRPSSGRSLTRRRPLVATERGARALRITAAGSGDSPRRPGVAPLTVSPASKETPRDHPGAGARHS